MNRRYNMTLRRVKDTFFEDHDLKPQTIVETINVDNALYLVNEGLGITVVPASVILNLAIMRFKER